MKTHTTPAKLLNSYYEELAFDLADGDAGRFLSGWQCENPYASDFLEAVRDRCRYVDYRKYQYFDDDEELATSIRKLHRTLDGVSPGRVLCASGSTVLLYAFVTYLKRLGVTCVHYVPPLYHTLRIALETYGMNAVAVSNEQPFEEAFSLRLPQEKSCVLFVTDPIWFTGTMVPAERIREIARWQKQTSSIVFVDGSFQYLAWDGPRPESTASLSPRLTFRLLSPSKQLAVHGYRFSYLLLPASHERGMAWTYSNVAGPASAESMSFAREAIDEIASGRIPRQLTQLVGRRHRHLRSRGVIESQLTPECGYFVFERVNVPLPAGYAVMNSKYFELEGFDNYMKINLLSPSMNLLHESKMDGRRIIKMAETHRPSRS